MSNYAVILELRKKNIPFFLHLIHFGLTVLTLLWGVVWFVHWAVVHLHNNKLDKQIDKLIESETKP